MDEQDRFEPIRPPIDFGALAAAFGVIWLPDGEELLAWQTGWSSENPVERVGVHTRAPDGSVRHVSIGRAPITPPGLESLVDNACAANGLEPTATRPPHDTGRITLDLDGDEVTAATVDWPPVRMAFAELPDGLHLAVAGIAPVPVRFVAARGVR